MTDTKELVERLRKASLAIYLATEDTVADDISSKLTIAADTIKRMERERDEARKECDKLASAWAANLSSKSETVTALRARLAKMEEALRDVMFLAAADHACLLSWNRTGSGANYEVIMARADAALIEEPAS